MNCQTILYVLMPMLDDIDAIAFFQTNHHNFALYSKYRVKRCIDVRVIHNTNTNRIKPIFKHGLINNADDLIVIPEHLQQLTFAHSIVQPIGAGVLPQSLQRLTLGDEFNQRIEIDVLPLSLRHLTFGYNFNQRVPTGVLPMSLQSLTFGYQFNRFIEKGDLPPSLQNLTLGFRFNRFIETVFYLYH